MIEPRTGLERAIDPLSIETFLADVWEKEPLVQARSAPSHFRSLTSVAEFDSIVASSGLRHPYFRVFRRGQLLPVGQTTTSRQLGPDVDSGLADLNKLYDEYAVGGTLALQAAERWWPPFRNLARDFQRELGFPAQVHVYLTPAGAQGAPVHYDTHDVFVLQVEGAKTWDVWRPTKELPLRLSEDDYDEVAVEVRSRSEPTLTVTLEAGHSLYLPRGFIHRARTESTSSLHVTVSIMVDRWVDVAEAAIERRLTALRDLTDLRDSIPFGRTPMAKPTDGEIDRFRSGVEVLTHELALDLEGGLASVREESRDYLTPTIRGRFVDLVEAPSLDGSAVLARRAEPIAAVIEADGQTIIRSGSAEVPVDARHHAALAFAMASASFQPTELPGDLTAEERLAFARRLVELGLCTVNR